MGISTFILVGVLDSPKIHHFILILDLLCQKWPRTIKANVEKLCKTLFLRPILCSSLIPDSLWGTLCQCLGCQYQVLNGNNWEEYYLNLSPSQMLHINSQEKKMFWGNDSAFMSPIHRGNSPLTIWLKYLWALTTLDLQSCPEVWENQVHWFCLLKNPCMREKPNRSQHHSTEDFSLLNILWVTSGKVTSHYMPLIAWHLISRVICKEVSIYSCFFLKPCVMEIKCPFYKLHDKMSLVRHRWQNFVTPDLFDKM